MTWQLRQRLVFASVALLTLTFGMAIVADCTTQACKEHTVKGALGGDGDISHCYKTGHSICWLSEIFSNTDIGAIGQTTCIAHSTVTVEMWMNCPNNCDLQCGPAYIQGAPYAGSLSPIGCINPDNPKRRFCMSTTDFCGVWQSWNEEHDADGVHTCD
jgi:hypothetical protein